MSRFVKLAGQSSVQYATGSDVCNILCTYTGTLSAGNACLVCNLRTQYEIICYCQCWATCYGTSFTLSLPTTQYSEFQFGMFGICNDYAVAMGNYLHFGNDSCFCTSTSPPAYCGVQANMSGGCLINCLTAYGQAVCWGTTTTCNQSSIFINFKKSWGNTAQSTCISCPFIQWCGYYTGNCQVVGESFFGITTAANNAYWRTTSASDAFTKMRICSNCAIKAQCGYWYLLGMKNRTCAI